MSRFDWFMETYMPSKVLDYHNGSDFTEIVIKEGGDIITYRVHGNEKDGFKVSVR